MEEQRKRKVHPTNEKVEGRGKRRVDRVNKILDDAKRGSEMESDNTTEPPSPLSPKPYLLRNGEDPYTPYNLPPPRNIAQQTPPTDQSNGNGIAIKEVDNRQEKGKPKEGQMMFEGFNVDLKVSDEEYVLRIKRRKIECSTDEDIEKGAKQMAENAGMLLGQAKMLGDKGNKQLDQYLAMLQHITEKSASRNILSFGSDDLD